MTSALTPSSLALPSLPTSSSGPHFFNLNCTTSTTKPLLSTLPHRDHVFPACRSAPCATTAPFTYLLPCSSIEPSTTICQYCQRCPEPTGSGRDQASWNRRQCFQPRTGCG